jgi:pilus assembly protein FimV
MAGPVHALGLGQIAQQSVLGDSLRVVVPVIAGPNEDVSGECIKLAPAQRSTDGIPEVLSARVALERTAAGARIVVTTARAVTDPVLKLTLQAGCESVVRREYVMLMDPPPPIEAPTAQPSAALPAAAPTTTVVAPGGPAAAAGGSARAARHSAGTRTRARRGAASAGTASRPKPSGGAAAARTKTTPKPATATAPRPRLSVSNAAPAPAAAGAGVAGTPAASAPAPDTRGAMAQGETAAALDAQAAALQRRVVELTAMVDRMQQQLKAAETQQAARAAEAKAADSSPLAMLGRAWNEGWPLVAAVVVAAALIAALLALRRRRAPVAAAPWRMEVPAPGRTGTRPPMTTQPAPASAVAPPSIPAATPAAPITAGQAAGTTVDVSELSHVTEEAGVYLAFNRPDRAIDVLRQHIDTEARSLPAAWVMLLDLYHAQGREQAFRELAARFHAQFNAQTPDWDAYRPQAQTDRGLEAFPHLTRKLALIWGKPDCRDFLDSLLRENREGQRSGFSLAAYEDILFLRQLADTAGSIAPAGKPAAAPARAPGPSAASVVASVKRPPTLDLELALDEDMLDAGKPRPARAAASPSAGEPKTKP